MGYSALEVGSDIGGSIRVPAMFCGVYGHKTSYDLAPMGGHCRWRHDRRIARSLGVIGPMARSAEDLATTLDVIAGPDAESPANKVILPLARHGQLAEFPGVRARPSSGGAVRFSDILGALEHLADALTKAGATVARQSSLLPDLTGHVEDLPGAASHHHHPQGRQRRHGAAADLGA